MADKRLRDLAASRGLDLRLFADASFLSNLMDSSNGPSPPSSRDFYEENLCLLKEEQPQVAHALGWMLGRLYRALQEHAG